MCRGEGDVACGVVVFGGELEGEGEGEEGVEGWDDVAPAGDGEGAVLAAAKRGARGGVGGPWVGRYVGGM